jgi:hypothetical protein
MERNFIGDCEFDHSFFTQGFHLANIHHGDCVESANWGPGIAHGNVGILGSVPTAATIGLEGAAVAVPRGICLQII